MHPYKPKKKVKKELTRRKKSDIIIKLSGTAERRKLKNKRREPRKVREKVVQRQVKRQRTKKEVSLNCLIICSKTFKTKLIDK